MTSVGARILAGVAEVPTHATAGVVPVRVVHYCRHALAGESGVANSARRWAAAQAGLGMDVALVVDAAQVRLDDVVGVGTIPLPHRHLGPVASARGLDRVLTPRDLLVVHGGWDPSTTFAAAVARRRATPVVVLSHGVYHLAAQQRGWARKQAWAWAFERRMLRASAAVHVLFGSERRGLEQLGVHAPLIVAPNGVDAPGTTSWDGGSGGFLLYLGRYDPVHKGLDLLLRGLASLPPSERPPLRLHGPDGDGGKATVAALVAELGIARDVTLGDPVYGPQKWALLESAIGFVLTSRWEGAPMSLGEAASVGLPALVTDYDMGTMLADEGAAVLVDRTPEAIAEGLRKLTGPDAATIGAQARAFVTERMTWDAVAHSWLTQIRELGLVPEEDA